MHRKCWPDTHWQSADAERMVGRCINTLRGSPHPPGTGGPGGGDEGGGDKSGGAGGSAAAAAGDAGGAAGGSDTGGDAGAGEGAGRALVYTDPMVEDMLFGLAVHNAKPYFIFEWCPVCRV